MQCSASTALRVIDVACGALQLRYLRQLHAMLADEHIKRSSAHKEILQWARRVVRNVCNRLAPPPPMLPASALPAPAAAADGAPDAGESQRECTDEAVAGPSGLNAAEEEEAARERMLSAIDRAMADDQGTAGGHAEARDAIAATHGLGEGKEADVAETGVHAALSTQTMRYRMRALRLARDQHLMSAACPPSAALFTPAPALLHT